MVIYKDALYKEIEHQQEVIKRALADPCFSGRERAEMTHEYEVLGKVLTMVSMLSKKTAEGKDEEKVAENTFVYEEKHRTAMILACECLRDHGWFNRERDFIDLWGFIEGTNDYETLFNGTNHNKKVKLLKAEENG